MARKNASESTAPAETPAEATTEATEDDAPIDLTEFQSAVTTAYGTRDTSTGDIAVADLAPVTEAYRALEGQKPKRAARDLIEADLKGAVKEKDIVLARAVVAVREALKPGKSSSAAVSTPKDPTDLYVNKIAVLAAALQLAQAEVPEGVNDGWSQLAQTRSAELVTEAGNLLAQPDDADLSEFSADSKKVAKLTKGKVAGGGHTFTGPRRDIGKHIAEAFEDVEVGTFLTVNEIAKKQSSEYGSDQPSSGAISSRLFPKNGGAASLPEGVEAVDADKESGTKRGARKVA